MSDKHVYRVYTYHGTQIFLDGKQTVLHRDFVTASYRLYPLYAHMVDGGVELFTIRDNRFKYIRALDGRRTAESEESTVLEYIRNDDDTISIKLGDRFLSAHQRNEELVLQPHNRAWEHFTLERAEFELTREYIPPLVSNFTPEDEPTATVDQAEEVKVAVPAISVIIPMYNVEEYIEECLASVLNQTFGDYEVIVVDDCSTDGSAAIVEDMAPKFDGRLKLVRLSRNTGAAATPRNIGAGCAIGKYLYFMDSDDALKEDALEILCNAAEKFNADVVGSSANYHLETDGSTKLIDYLKLKHPVFRPSDPAWRLREFIPGIVFGLTPWMRLIRRRLFVENKLSFPNMYIFDDAFFSFECALCSKVYVLLPDAFYLWRLRDTSSTHVRYPTIDTTLDKHVQLISIIFRALGEFMSRQNFFIENPWAQYKMAEWFFNFFFRGSGMQQTRFYHSNTDIKTLYTLTYKYLANNNVLDDRIVAYSLFAVSTQSNLLKVKERQIERLRLEFTAIKN